MDGSLVIMECSLLLRFLLLQWMVAVSLWEVVCCCNFCYSNEWKHYHYGRKTIVEIFVTPMDGILVIIDGIMSLIFLLLNGC